MATTAPTPVAHPASAPAAPAPARYTLGRIGAVCLVLAPVLFGLGIATAPKQAETTRASFVQSLVDEPNQSIVSGNFLHYSWLAWIVGLVAVLGLVHGRGRGHAFTQASAVLGILGSVQISGLMFTDFFMISIGKDVPVDTIAGAFDNLDTASFVWLFSAQVMALLFVPLTFLALARAGYVKWYVAAPALIGFMVMSLPVPFIGIVAGIACYASALVIARTLWRGPQSAPTA